MLEKIYSYVAKHGERRGPTSAQPVAFLSPIGGSTDQPAVLTMANGLSCTCTRTRREFSKALQANGTRIMVHIVDLDFSAFIAFHKTWTHRERRKYRFHDVQDTFVPYESTDDLYEFQAEHKGDIMFIHWNNDIARCCSVRDGHYDCKDCWLHRNQTQQQALRTWLEYQQCLEQDQERVVVQHCANTTDGAEESKTRSDYERMRTIYMENTGGACEERDVQEPRTKNVARSSSREKNDRPRDYCEREEFCEIVVASENMRGAVFWYGIDPNGPGWSPQFETPPVQHTWEIGSGTSGLKVLQTVFHSWPV
jgi:hypothetical protein